MSTAIEAGRSLDQERRRAIRTLIKTVDLNPYIPHEPTGKQARFLAIPGLVAIYGGAAGGGKSDCLLMAGLQYASVPGYSAILFRRTFTDLSLPGALMDRSHEWLDQTDAEWSEARKRWTFPSGASLSFGYMENERDRFRYQSAEFQFVGFDELTEFSERCYRFMFSRLRRLLGHAVPLRMRAASNPGGIGHDWVKLGLVENPEVPFVPARLSDNPFLDQEQYSETLGYLDPITRAQLLRGDWSARALGGKFRREWFEIVEDYPREADLVRFWDLAATEPKRGHDPDYTVGLLMATLDGVYWILGVRRIRGTPAEVEALVKQTAKIDGKSVRVFMEQEPGSSGKTVIDHYARIVLPGFAFYGKPSTGSKEARAIPLSAAAQNGNVKLVAGAWIPDFLDEAEGFPLGAHDDQVDAASGAHEALCEEEDEDFVV